MTDLRQRLRELTPPRASLRSRLLALGFGGGTHRAERRGSGVEFAAHREYMPGDDLRHLDRHALLRHGKHLIREFHTETERSLWLIVDASPSMHFRSEDAPDSKRGVALLLAAALAAWARRSGDPVGLCLAGVTHSIALSPRLGSDQFERILALLDTEDQAPLGAGSAVDFASRVEEVARRAARGSSIVVLSDLLDRSPALQADLASLAARRRAVTVVQILDPHEVSFPYRGAVRLQDSESGLVIDTDAERVRDGYLRALATWTADLASAVRNQGGDLLRVETNSDSKSALRRIQRSLAGAPEESDGVGLGVAKS